MPHHAELDTLRAVSTVPPRTTSFIPSTTDEPPAPPTRGCIRDLRASIMVRCSRDEGSQCGEVGQGDGDGRRKSLTCDG